MLKHLRTGTPVIAGIILLVFGIFVCEKLGLYYALPGLDKFMHVVGGIVAAWFVLTLFQQEISHMAPWKQMCIFVGVTALIGVIWEWAEYASNFTRATYPWWYHYFHGGDLADTLGDLLADTIGAALLTLWALRKERSR
jgi:hypothetical protein